MGPALTRCERYTAVSASPRDSLSSPDVREIRWFLHLRIARDVPGKDARPAELGERTRDLSRHI
jgi:hypothetical protein